jgi:hypothetical protein
MFTHIKYRIHSPSDRVVIAACSAVGCEHFLHGWESRVDESTDLGKEQAKYIRLRSGRDFKESKDGGVTVFRFSSRQRCFRDHKTRPERYTVFGSGLRVHRNPADWVEDFAEHQENIASQIERYT